MEEGATINDYIFPYIDFTYHKDGNYYTAKVMKGASPAVLYIPSSIEDKTQGSIPVKSFEGFATEEDAQNLKTIIFESPETIIKEGVLDKSPKLSYIQYKKVELGQYLWTNLPYVPDTAEKEFVGWMTYDEEEPIYRNTYMFPGKTKIKAEWKEHQWDENPADKEKAPSCTEDGWKNKKVCTSTRTKNGTEYTCGYYTYEIVPALGHSLQFHQKSEPSCLDGYTQDCWECTRCHLFFKDSNATTAFNKTDNIVIEATGHISDLEEGWHTSTSQHWHHCTVCDEDYDTADHTFGDWDYNPQTAGVKQQRTCNECKYVESSNEDHDWVEVVYKASTCTEKGNNAYWKCKNHADEYKKSNESSSEILSWSNIEKDVVIECLAHTLGDWQTNEKQHWKICSSCKGTFELANHTWDYTFEPDAESGNTIVKRICTDCKYEATGTSSGGVAFDVSASYGKISVKKTSFNEWKLTYPSTAKGCIWKDQEGKELARNTYELTVKYGSVGKGVFYVFCSELDENGKEVDISFVMLTTY